MDRAATRDVRALLDVVGAIEYGPSGAAFAESGLTALCGLIAADFVTYCARSRGAPWDTVEVTVGTRTFCGDTDELMAILLAHHHHFQLGGLTSCAAGVVLNPDVISDRAGRRTAFSNEWCREVHLEPPARVELSVPGAPFCQALMIDLADDTGRSFGERERTLLRLVRQGFRRPIERAWAAYARQRALGLTRREPEVLALVGDGLTHGEIATRLFLSPTTVRTHLENAFARLGVPTPTQATARLRALGGVAVWPASA